MTLANMQKNVSTTERWATAVAGGVLAGLGLSRKSVLGMVLAAIGGLLLARGVSGRCPVYHLLGLGQDPETTLLPADEPLPPAIDEGDEVLEASWESFPTSDAPSWTMGRDREES